MPMLAKKIDADSAKLTRWCIPFNEEADSLLFFFSWDNLDLAENTRLGRLKLWLSLGRIERGDEASINSSGICSELTLLCLLAALDIDAERLVLPTPMPGPAPAPAPPSTANLTAVADDEVFDNNDEQAAPSKEAPDFEWLAAEDSDGCPHSDDGTLPQLGLGPYLWCWMSGSELRVALSGRGGWAGSTGAEQNDIQVLGLLSCLLIGFLEDADEVPEEEQSPCCIQIHNTKQQDGFLNELSPWVTYTQTLLHIIYTLEDHHHTFEL